MELNYWKKLLLFFYSWRYPFATGLTFIFIYIISKIFVSIFVDIISPLMIFSLISVTSMIFIPMILIAMEHLMSFLIKRDENIIKEFRKRKSIWDYI